jgi:anti-anti-sigma factor
MSMVIESATRIMDMELASKRFADTAVLFPEGRIDHATAEQFKAALAPHLAAAGRERLVIDLTGVEYISSVGLRVLMLASKQAKAQGCALGVCGLQPVVREIFEISRFNLVLQVFPTLREALAALSTEALAAFEAA